ncbi:MAG: hypothetical protein QF754_21250 [Alphaproteobacteria bacterium]|jgi:hypothetical protein|nr:hypothetical protein [Alphaproteobacteria bacterium]|tara:strand:+ start:4254 stop:4415 length:162 start_codon:yes stop_codon:yes gene_type:complete
MDFEFKTQKTHDVMGFARILLRRNETQTALTRCSLGDAGSQKPMTSWVFMGFV